MSTEIQKVKAVVANPTAMGLFGLAMVTLVASSQKLGLTSGLSFVLPWAIFLGGLLQLVACIYDFQHDNIFGATAFGAYGFFWIAVGFAWLIKMGVLGPALAGAIDGKQLGYAFIGYLILSFFLTICALEINKVLLFDMLVIDLLLFCLALDAFGMGKGWAHSVAAYSELVISLTSFYLSGALLVNGHFGRVIFPTGAPLGIIKKG